MGFPPIQLARLGRVLHVANEKMNMTKASRVLAKENANGREIGKENVKEKENARDEATSRICHCNSSLRHSSNMHSWRKVLVMDRLHHHHPLRNSIAISS